MDSHYTISSKSRMRFGRKAPQKKVVDEDNLRNVKLLPSRPRELHFFGGLNKVGPNKDEGWQETATRNLFSNLRVTSKTQWRILPYTNNGCLSTFSNMTHQQGTDGDDCVEDKWPSVFITVPPGVHTRPLLSITEAT